MTTALRRRALACAALYGKVPDLDPRLLHWDPDTSAPDDLWLAEVRALPGDADTVADVVLTAHLAPLAEAVHARYGVAAGLLRGNAASALAGASPATNFLKITAPLIIKPLAPLLVSAFAFNFNNFVLIALLTDGRPDFLSTKLPAGQTDILVSYTYRIAFRDSGSDFGLAAAISTLIFFLVAALSLINLRLSAKAQK